MPQPSGCGTRTRHTVLYHVWFSPKRRKWLLRGDVETSVIQLLKETANEKGIRLLEVEAAIDHVHILLELSADESLSRVMNLLKGVTARRIFQHYPELKLDSGVNHLWQKRYGYKPVPEAALQTVRKYIQTQKDRLEKFER